MSDARRIGIGALGLTLVLSLPAHVTGQEPELREPPDTTPYVVGEALPPVDSTDTLVELTLEQAISTALEANLDIQAARLDPRIQAFSLQAARAAFNPTLSTNYGYTNSTSQSTSQLDGGARTTSQRHTLNTSLSQDVRWYGGRLSANFNNSRLETNNAFATRNPSYSSTLSFNYTQPLLSGRTTDSQRASLETQSLQGEVTDLQVESRIENITNQVRAAYWNLRATIEQIEIQRRSLAQAERLLAENRLRLQYGRMTEMQVAQAEAQVASAAQALLNAEIQWLNQEYAFKLLLVGGPDDALLYRTINPTSQPTLVTQEVDIESAVEFALRERKDLRQRLLQREVSEVNLEVTESSALPTLDLTAGYSLSGVGGNLFERSGLGGEPELVQQGGYLDGLGSIADFDTPTWSLQLTGSYPLGTNPAEASLERARLQLEQTQLDLRRQELVILTQVTTAGLAVRNSFLQLEAARRSREAAERTAEAELARFSVGVATNYEVTQAQDELTAARLSELRAIINHVNAIDEFERVQRVGG